MSQATNQQLQGFSLLRYVANKPAVAIITSIPNGDEDPDAVSEMVDTSPNVQPEAEWREQFAKFFIGKNDDWTHMGKVLRVFIAAVDAENDDATATKSMSPPPPPPPTPAKDPPLTKKASDKKKTTKKRKVQLEDSDDEVKMTVASMLYLMSKHKVSYEVVLRDYADELQPDLNYDLLRSFAPILKSTAVKLTRIAVNHNMLVESDFLRCILSVLIRVKI